MVVVHRMFGDAKAGVLELLHHLQADHAAVFFEPHHVENAPPHQAEIAIDIPHLQPEQQLHHVVVDAADDDAMQRIRAADLQPFTQSTSSVIFDQSTVISAGSYWPSPSV